MVWQWDNVHAAITRALVDSTNESNSCEVSCSCASNAEVLPNLSSRAVTRSLPRAFCVVLLPVAISLQLELHILLLFPPNCASM